MALPAGAALVLQHPLSGAPQVVHLWTATLCLARPSPAVVMVVSQPPQRCFATQTVGLIAPRAMESVRAVHWVWHFAHDGGVTLLALASETRAGRIGFTSSSAPWPLVGKPVSA